MIKIILILFTAVCFNTYAQSTRELVNEGVEAYNNKKYTDAEVNFKKGVEAAPNNFTAKFNLGASYYKQERYDEAVKAYQSALSQTGEKEMKAKTYHNIGNSLLKSEKLKESIEAYKNALKLNPDDADTKYNLSYAQSLLNNQNKDKNKQDKNEKKDGDNKDDKDKNGEKDNKDKQNDKNDENNKGDNKDDEQQQNDKKDGDKDNKGNEGDENKPDNNETAQQDNLKQQENKISKEEAERILQALKNNEKDLQKKLRKKSGVPVKTEKDW